MLKLQKINVAMPATLKPFLALTLQHHRQLGTTIGAYLATPTESHGIYIISENAAVAQPSDLEDIVSPIQKDMLQQLQQISDKALQKYFDKQAKSVAEFLDSLTRSEQLNSHVHSYVERRIAKVVALAAHSDTPIFLRKKEEKNLYEENRLNVELEPTLPLFRFELTPDSIMYSIMAMNNGRTVNLTTTNGEVVTNNPCIIRIDRTIYQFEAIDGKKLTPFLSKPYITVPKSAEKKYMQTFVLNAIRHQQVEAVGFNIVDEQHDGRAILTLEERLAGGWCLTLKFSYGDRGYLCNTPYNTEVRLVEEGNGYTFRRFNRNRIWESRVICLLSEKFNLQRVSEAEFLPAAVENAKENLYPLVEWLNQHVNQLKTEGFAVAQLVRGMNFYLNGVVVAISTDSTTDWFDLYGKIKLDGFEIPFVYLKRNILKNIREFLLPNGQVFIIPEVWFSRYKPLMLIGKEENEGIRLPKSLFGLLADTNEVNSPAASELRHRLSNLKKEGIQLPQRLNARLRSYQLVGYAWLKLLNQNGINGCLADDMGLGKTIQALTLLQSINEEQNYATGMGKTSLVVVPTSLVANWISEAGRFTPELKVAAYMGQQRVKSASWLLNHHVVVTTYGLIRNDIDMFREVTFRYVVLDESQTVKNPLTKGYRSVMQLRAINYLSLSGTPVENSLLDLWSQLNFLNRGMLGGLRAFRNEFQTPIERQGDHEKEKQLKQLIEPLILRRTKEEVAKDLPEISEQVVYCRMSDSQKEIYEKEKSVVRNFILETLDSPAPNQSTVSILASLTRLRQIANHPAMLPEYRLADSGKFDEVAMGIESATAGHHKILVFSSFVRHLEQVEVFLQDRKIGYEKLTGSSANRSEIVERFQTDPDKKVFLISLKAGGVGLNITAADYVFILDPWWNPAAEMQAASRSHRIGQDKKVFVYRFITSETVEEKILSMQERKENLAQLFVSSSSSLGQISREAILELLE